jgi:hypothetical protein
MPFSVIYPAYICFVYSTRSFVLVRSTKEIHMRKAILLSFILTAGAAVYATEASAAVCARGVHRAGCISPRGAVAVRRMPGRTVVRTSRVHPRRGVVVHRRAVIR